MPLPPSLLCPFSFLSYALSYAVSYVPSPMSSPMVLAAPLRRLTGVVFPCCFLFPPSFSPFRRPIPWAEILADRTVRSGVRWRTRWC